MKKVPKIIVLAAVLAGLTGSILLLVYYHPQASGRPMMLPEKLGNKNARVRISVNIPFGQECVEEAVEVVLAAVKDWPEYVYVEFPPIFEPEEAAREARGKEVSADGEAVPTVEDFGGTAFCAYIRINGRTRFILPGEAGREPQRIWLSGPVDELYTAEDLKRLIEREMIKQYGSLPRPGRGK
jgi:hypothetical protein